MLLIGCSPSGRHTEQHDVFFGIGDDIRDILPELPMFWPEANNTLHLDAWREVTHQDGYVIEVIPKTKDIGKDQLFFINLGGYKPKEFEEFHYKLLTVASDKGEAIRASKQTIFYKHTGFKGATSHIDDRYGVDVDDAHVIHDILSPSVKNIFSLQITKTEIAYEDELHLGYFIPKKVDKWAPLQG